MNYCACLFGCVVFQPRDANLVFGQLICYVCAYSLRWLRSFQLRDANLVFRPPISYFVLASFFTISTLRLTGHEVARGLRYRYGEKIAL